MSRNMRAADARPADMCRTEGSAAVPAKPAAMSAKACEVSTATMAAAACPEAYSAAVPTKPAAMSAKACEVSAATMPAAATVSAATTVSTSAATMPAATAAAGVCFECEKRHDEEQHRGHASAGRQHQPHGAARLGAPHRLGRLSLGIPPRTKSF
jgi:hypothetical protein